MTSFIALLLLTAPPDAFPLMGEYAFTSPMDGAIGSVVTGLQVRPQSSVKGKPGEPQTDADRGYELVGYAAGLPGLGWDGTEPTRTTMSAADAARHLRDINAWSVQRVSPTIGRAMPEGGTMLFDAAAANETAAKNWDGANIENGLLNSGVTTKRLFGDCSLHLEFNIPLQTGKLDTWRGNSGVYIQNRYEVQVLDSFADPIRENGCGSIYRLHTPPQNLSLPPGQWQTLDIDFTAARFEDGEKTANARMTVRHNGVLLFDDVEIPKLTNGHKLEESAAPGPIHLQDHGDPVVYRNVWVVER